MGTTHHGRTDGPTDALTLAKGGTRGSSFKYLPRYLLYRTDDILRDTDLGAVARHINRVLPALL